jgi:hypothetical protein
VAKAKWQARSKGRIPLSHMNGLTLRDESRVGERFENLRLDYISVITSHLNRCVFSNILAHSVCLGGGATQSTYADCVFEDCDWIFSVVGKVRILRCEFNRCRLSNLFGTNLEAIGCSFNHTTIKKGVFHGTGSSAVAVAQTNEFRDNDFSEADLIDVDFRGGIDVSKQRLPMGGEYVFIGDTCQALEVLNEMLSLPLSAIELKRVQLETLSLRRYCSSGQLSQLLRLSSWGTLADEFRRRLAMQSERKQGSME